MNFDGKDKDLTRLEGADFTIDRAATGAGKKLWDVFLSKVKTTIAFDKYQAPKAAPKVPKPNH
jgi:hypothetical protein